MYYMKRSSKDRLLDKIGDTYGEECILYFGDWSRSDQVKGCTPSPTKGIRKLVSKRFLVVDVDDHRTSKIYNYCCGVLTRYRNRRGKLSHSRLQCTSCKQDAKGRPRFVDRDRNAAANILWA